MLTALPIILYCLVVVTVCLIIINSNTPSKALAYLFLVLVFPVVGIILYFSVGVNYRNYKMYTKKLDVDKHTFPELEARLTEFSNKQLQAYKPQLKHFANLANFSHINNILTANNVVKLLINGEEKFPQLLNDLKNAKDHIHIEYYIYENDTIGTQIAEILKQKAQQGVEVRFIYDDFGSKAIRKSFVRNLKEAGVEAFPFYKIKLIALANRMNYRNHRKIVVIDGKVGYVGGINVSDKYINPNKYNLFWRDTHLKITGAATLNLQKVFLADWNFCSQQNIGVTKAYFPLENLLGNDGNTLVQTIGSGPDSDHPNILYSLIQAILLAKEEVLITTPYFVPDASFLNAVKIARLSNVTLKLLVPGKSDSAIVNAICNSYYKELLQIGVEVYKYQKGFVHAKTMVCDGLMATIGTANLDQRSFDLNFEINAFVYDKALATQLKNEFFKDLKNAKKLELSTWSNRSYLTVFAERFLRLFAPLF